MDDSGEAHCIIQLLLLTADRPSDGYKLSSINTLKSFPTLTCSLSSFCCFRLFRSSSSTLLTWINRSFCTHATRASMSRSPWRQQHVQKCRGLPSAFRWFPREAPLGTWCRREKSKTLATNPTPPAVPVPVQPRRHSLPVEGLVDQLSLKPGGQRHKVFIGTRQLQIHCICGCLGGGQITQYTVPTPESSQSC